MFKSLLLKYLKNSSLHGVKHLTNVNRNHSIEMVFWTLTIAVIFLFASYNTSLVWLRYLYNSTVITIDREYLYRNTTFPPITLCLRDRLNKTAAEEFLIARNFTPEQRGDPKMINFLKVLSNFNINNLGELIDIKQNYFRVDEYLNVLDKISNKFPHNISLSFISTSDEHLFDPVLIDTLGLCYTFNSKISSFFSPSYIGSKDMKIDTTHKMTEEINYFDGDASAVTSDLSHNVDVYYHGPYSLASDLRKVVNENPTQKSYMTLSIVPVIIKSQDKIRNLFEFQRQCKFTEENVLSFFPNIYSQDLCFYECRMKKLKDICKCIPFFYKRRDGNDRQCSTQGLKCVVRNRAILDSLQVGSGCQCPKDCNDIKYSLQSSTSMIWFHDSRISWKVIQTKVIYKRELIHDTIEALILTGACFSLFTGMSCLSIVELFFFIHFLFKNDRKSGKKALKQK
ncbi:hypothetical protein PVAND_002830 [Polypedilum vanderplanki]|uniref:Uncharacterized protein n=1 Tax=Polypedilum vanderplanki TaxID=319348 RepID=A0A9J6BS73_POLVA|nr:hypothetical protein PVAND_002830 [Polypedilum vanderplanki]